MAVSNGHDARGAESGFKPFSQRQSDHNQEPGQPGYGSAGVRGCLAGHGKALIGKQPRQALAGSYKKGGRIRQAVEAPYSTVVTTARTHE